MISRKMIHPLKTDDDSTSALANAPDVGNRKEIGEKKMVLILRIERIASSF